MALINGPADATAAGYAGGMGIQGIIKLIQMLRKKKQMTSPTGIPGAGGPMAPPDMAGIGGLRSMGTTKPMGAPSMADLVGPMMNKARTFGSTGGSDMPYGTEGPGGDLQSVMLPPGEGANPTNDQTDVIAAIMPFLKQLGLGGTGRGF